MYSKGRIFFCFLIDSLHARFFFVIIIIIIILMQILALVESVFKSKQAQKRKKIPPSVSHVRPVYIYI